VVDREREKEGGKSTFERERERESFSRSSRHPSSIKEVSVAGPSDLACPKGLQ
jgi:hypothetical protein